MLSLFKSKKRLQPVSNPHLSIRKSNQEDFEKWCNEVGATKCYTTFRPFEDSSVVSDALDFRTQLKIEMIMNEQRRFMNK